MTAHKFGQTPSSLLEIRDWWIAREMDVAAAVFLHEEEMKREAEREKRDREFWVTMFGGQAESDGSQMFTSAEDIKFATFDRSRAERW